MKTWMTFSVFLFVCTALVNFAVLASDWGGILLYEGMVIPSLDLLVIFLLAIIASAPFLKQKISPRLARFAGWVVAAFPFILALAMAWEVADAPVAEQPTGWAGLAGFFLLSVALFAGYVLLLRLFHLLGGLITEPPRSAIGWCQRLSGWAFLAVVTAGGWVSLTSWLKYDAARHCAFYDGALDTTAPAMREHLDALTEGTFRGFSQVDRYVEEFSDRVFWEPEPLEGLEAKAKASYARKEFLLLHTQYGGCEMLNEEKYAWWLERMSAERDWPEAHYLLALRHGYGGFVDGVLNDTGGEWWINGGDEYRAPVANSHGNGENLDLEKSFALLQRAARGGYRHAQWVLGRVYATGFWGKDDALAVGVDYGKSTAWLERYVDKNQDVGMGAFYTLGYRYRHGERYGLQPDYRKAFKYLSGESGGGGKKAFEARLELALMFKEGLGSFAPYEREARSQVEKAGRELAELTWLIPRFAELFSLEEDAVAHLQAALEEKRRRLREVSIAIGYHDYEMPPAVNRHIAKSCLPVDMEKFRPIYYLGDCADEFFILATLVDFTPHLFGVNSQRTPA